ncbi:MAG TPA: ABC transporter ATP-binding protein [Caulobacteraceae bacterium]|nr:ABC transporter ATP-binding protein [Caulobacteraceae bacterium]
MTHLLDVRDLTVDFRTEKGPLRVVDGVSFFVDAGETLAIVGESGSGKSVTALSLLRLLGDAGRMQASQATFEGVELNGLDAAGIRALRGNRIAMIFQEPMSSLNPVLTIGEQVAEPLRLHKGLNRREARAAAAELLRKVSIPDAHQRLDHYPHQFSGGMRQRVMIAMAIACEPALIIADEPTTALDVTVQAQILDLLNGLLVETRAAMILITHDLGVVARVADRVAVMYAGRIVESASTRTLFAAPRHPYTRALLASSLLPGADAKSRLDAIEGQPPDPSRLPGGCAFAPRCPVAGENCHQTRPPLSNDAAGQWACYACD